MHCTDFIPMSTLQGLPGSILQMRQHTLMWDGSCTRPGMPFSAALVGNSLLYENPGTRRLVVSDTWALPAAAQTGLVRTRRNHSSTHGSSIPRCIGVPPKGNVHRCLCQDR